MSTETILCVQGLCSKFGNQVVHENLNLEVRRGTVLGMVGGSGAGKSVLMRTLIGLRKPVAGKVKLFDQDLYSLSRSQRHAIERRIGVLFQDGALFSSLNVCENVCLPLLEHTALSRYDAMRLATLKITLAGLSLDTRSKYPAELSGGMRKRVALARALALDPEILFLDEPTSGLDPIAAADFDALLRTLRDALGLTVYMNTHDLDSIHAVCDQVAVLAEGKVLINADLNTVKNFQHPWVKRYFQGPRGRAASMAAAPVRVES